MSNIEFPKFNGDEPRGWIRKCQWYFQTVYTIPDDQRVSLASIHLEVKQSCGSKAWGDSYEETKEMDMTVSINALSGNTDFNTFRVKGKAYGQELQLLIDGGSTHCFRDEETAIQLGYQLQQITPMVVSVADGRQMDIALNQLLAGYENLLQEPQGLPPRRDIEHQITLKPEAVPRRMHPYRETIEYLGHIITKEGVSTDPSKVECMKNWAQPRSIKELRGFLGLTGYYRKFIKGYGIMSKPLTELLKKDNFRWTQEASDAFECLKQAMISAPVLALPDFTQHFVIEADAYDKGIEAVLMQKQRPIAFLSKALSPRNQGLSVYEKDFWLSYQLCRSGSIMSLATTLLLKRTTKASNISWSKGWITLSNKGIQGTYQRIKGMFYWPGMKQDVVRWVQSCDVCQRSKTEHLPYPGLLQPLAIPTQAWSSISMDFIEGLPKSEGKDCILVVVDRLTKYAHFIALTHPFSTESVARTFMDSVYKLHGLPVNIFSDRDKVFTGVFWRELFKVLGTTLSLSTAYHPQTDGQTKRVNQCVENYLRCMCHLRPKQWNRVYPAKVLSRRLISRRNTVVPQLLVQWENYSETDVTWEDYYDIVAKFPEFEIDPQRRGPAY
ncbi:UNVERIFIED_CONTAM: Transposon Ty3-I Gag-Pol polyprotein [Sesamum calycinum]|uniref:Transposon Ty3-I Gag-Pol polyprotein n=1 Tax=Sesamum calycinum TaxID=2727403 RepID=A0AAW2SV60_9LAMI